MPDPINDKYKYKTTLGKVEFKQELKKNTSKSLQDDIQELEKNTSSLLQDDIQNNLNELADSYINNESDGIVKKNLAKYGQKIFNAFLGFLTILMTVFFANTWKLLSEDIQTALISSIAGIILSIVIASLLVIKNANKKINKNNEENKKINIEFISNVKKKVDALQDEFLIEKGIIYQKMVEKDERHESRMLEKDAKMDSMTKFYEDIISKKEAIIDRLEYDLITINGNLVELIKSLNTGQLRFYFDPERFNYAIPKYEKPKLFERRELFLATEKQENEINIKTIHRSKSKSTGELDKNE